MRGIKIEKITKQVSSQSACFELDDGKLIDLIEKLFTQATTGYVYVTRIAKNNYHAKAKLSITKYSFNIFQIYQDWIY